MRDAAVMVNSIRRCKIPHPPPSAFPEAALAVIRDLYTPRMLTTGQDPGSRRNVARPGAHNCPVVPGGARVSVCLSRLPHPRHVIPVLVTGIQGAAGEKVAILSMSFAARSHFTNVNLLPLMAGPRQ